MAVELTAELCCEFFDYNKEDGSFVNKGRQRKWFKSDGAYKAYNSRYKGKDINNHDKDGYKVVCIFGKDYRVHRLIMLMKTGKMPEYEVDHINGVRDDNRFSNLRCVSKKENTKNKCIRSNNTSGVNGVYIIKGTGKFRARISDGVNKNLSLGCFSDIWDAICARKSADNKLGYHSNHGRRAFS